MSPIAKAGELERAGSIITLGPSVGNWRSYVV